MADFYVDFSATNDGDGTAFGQAASGGAAGAYNTLASKTFTNGDKVWIRRVTRSGNYTSNVTATVAGIIYIGWPLSGDIYYSTRPSAAQSTWDADSGTFAAFSFSTGSFVVSGSNCELHRLYILSSSTSTPLSYSGNTGVNHYNSKFESSGSVSGVAFSTPLANFSYTGCEFKSGTWSIGLGGTPYISVTSAGCKFNNCTITLAGSNNNSSPLFAITAANTILANIVANLGTITSTMPVLLSITSSGLCSCDGFVVTATGFSSPTYNAAIVVSTNYNIIRNFQANFGSFINIGGSFNTVDIKGFTQKLAVSAGGMQIGGSGNTVILENTTFITGNTSGDIAMGGSQHSNTIICRNVLFANSTTPVTLTSLDNVMYSFDHNQIAGDFRLITVNCTAIASSTVRTGGETFSFKLQNTSSSSFSNGELKLSPLGRETIWLSLLSGSNTITIYGAYKNHTALTAADIWMDTEYANGSNVPVAVTTFGTGALTSDSSTWTGDTGLTPFKLVLTFTLPSNQVVPLRIYGTKYEASAYTYIDPKPVIT